MVRSRGSQVAQRRRCCRTSVLAVAGLVVALLAVAPASAVHLTPEERDITEACDVPGSDGAFDDIDADAHRQAIVCLAVWGVTTGRTPTRYDPGAVASRAQMASFLARMLDAVGADLSAEPSERFADVVPGSEHDDAIHALAAIEVVKGYGDGTFRPAEPVRRDQAASLVHLALRHLGPSSDGAHHAFADVAVASVHAEAVNGLAAFGITVGVGGTPPRFEPGRPVLRNAMASMLARTIALLVVEEIVAPPVEGAVATVVDDAGAAVGTVTFAPLDDDGVEVQATLAGLPPGFHGFHVHQTGACSPDFAAAGGHHDPAETSHGDHAGDLPSLLVRSDGRADLRVETDRFTVAELLADDGSAIMVHADVDNFANIPTDRYDPDPDAITLDTGDAGARIACGELAAGLTGPRPGAANATAEAQLRDAAGEPKGVVSFAPVAGGVEVNATFGTLPPGSYHGFHLHETGACEPTFAAAGGHHNPTATTHGGHAGDMPPLLVKADGSAAIRFVTDRFTRDELLVDDGTAAMLHAAPDNFANIPTDRYDPDPDTTTLDTGDAGSRLLCGVVGTDVGV